MKPDGCAYRRNGPNTLSFSLFPDFHQERKKMIASIQTTHNASANLSSETRQPHIFPEPREWTEGARERERSRQGWQTDHGTPPSPPPLLQIKFT